MSELATGGLCGTGDSPVFRKVARAASPCGLSGMGDPPMWIGDSPMPRNPHEQDARATFKPTSRMLVLLDPERLRPRSGCVPLPDEARSASQKSGQECPRSRETPARSVSLLATRYSLLSANRKS